MPYIEGILLQKVNREKTCVAYISKVKYLGYSFIKGKCRLRVLLKIVTKMKKKIRELTNRNNGWSNEHRALKLMQYVRGRVNFFALADMKQMPSKADEWLQYKIRTDYWKQ